MPALHYPGTALPTAALLALGAGACVQSPADAPAAPADSAPIGCMATGEGTLQAQLRGALVADLDWQNAQMHCEGGLRPDGKGLRVAIAGPMPNDAATQLRFIFGIAFEDAASGVAKALPTNLTVIVEGKQQLYATLGDDRCAVELLQRTPLAAATLDRVVARGYCTGPATDLSGDARLHLQTFAFTAQMQRGGEP